MADPETQKILTDADHVSNMLQSHGWGVIKRKLDQQILDLQNINNLNAESPLEPQLIGRKLASELLFAWLKQDVYGLVEAAVANAPRTKEEDTEIIDRGNRGK